MKSNIYLTLLALCGCLALSGCSKDDSPASENTEQNNPTDNYIPGDGKMNTRTISVRKAEAGEDGAFVGGGLVFIKSSLTENTVGVLKTSKEIENSTFTGGILIPAYIKCGKDTYTVTSIGSNVFADFLHMTDVSLPTTLKVIGDMAFCNCTSLKSVEIPESVIDIGEFAFCNTGLTSVEIPEFITEIKRGVFGACANLTSVKIPESVTFIGSSAFDRCASLASVKIPESVTSIGYDAFEECTSLTRIDIPNSVTEIGRLAFAYCTNLKTVSIPASVTEIDENAFEACPVTFYNCDNSKYITLLKSTVEYLTIGESVKEVPAFSFYECQALRNLVVYLSATSIGSWAFSGCTNLGFASLPDALITIGEGAFANCPRLNFVTIPNAVTTIGDLAFFNTDLRSVFIPNSVKSIGGAAFQNCTKLTQLSIGGERYVASNTTECSIGECAFNGCTALKEIWAYLPIPPNMSQNTFDEETYANCTLHLHEDQYETYMQAPYWNHFKDISQYRMANE